MWDGAVSVWDAEHILFMGVRCPQVVPVVLLALMLSCFWPGTSSWLSAHPVSQPGPAPSTHSHSQEGAGGAEQPVPAGTPPGRGEWARRAGEQWREELPARWPGPPTCHDAFIRATESPPGIMATLGEAGMAPEEVCPSPAPDLPGDLGALSPG